MIVVLLVLGNRVVDKPAVQLCHQMLAVAAMVRVTGQMAGEVVVQMMRQMAGVEVVFARSGQRDKQMDTNGRSPTHASMSSHRFYGWHSHAEYGG